MEVVVVLAIITILSAIIIPSFTGYTNRARLRSDIQSTRVVQSAFDLYRVEVGKDLGSLYSNVSAMIGHLTESDYLEGVPELQTEGAVWVYDSLNKKLSINIDDCANSIKNVRLSEAEEEYISVK